MTTPKDWSTLSSKVLHRTKKHLLTRRRLGQCLNPVDKVYGTLSLPEPAIAQQLTPNDDLSIREVLYGIRQSVDLRWKVAKAILGFLNPMWVRLERKNLNPDF